MPGAGGPQEIVHLGWRANGDGFDTALAVNRLRAAGARAWWLQTSHAPADAGDYLVDAARAQASALARLGLTISPWTRAIPTDARPLSCPRVRLFAGTASKFPYFAYYALCLLRLGIDYVACDGASLAGGTLDQANLLILPGGFATWGIDAAEDSPGADRQVRDFLAHGGTAIGSCGGAFYLSAGRPGWTGTAPAKPLYTHEYLQSGVGVVAIAMNRGPLAFGCPPTMEVPYYHGPIYDALGDGIDVAATFHALALPGRLAIDNPLDRDSFERDLKGKPAILAVAGDRGRAVLFSPHPEMGDLVRKYIALDGYVRHYLPIRGFGTMRDTLRHYRVTDAPSFRLVQNAIDTLMIEACAVERVAEDRGEGGSDDLAALCRDELAKLPDLGQGDQGALQRGVAEGIATRLEGASARLASVLQNGETRASLQASWRHLASSISEHWRSPAQPTAGQQLMELDLAVSLMECWTRASEFDRSLSEAA
jgi:hypothetical protein